MISLDFKLGSRNSISSISYTNTFVVKIKVLTMFTSQKFDRSEFAKTSMRIIY